MAQPSSKSPNLAASKQPQSGFHLKKPAEGKLPVQQPSRDTLVKKLFNDLNSQASFGMPSAQLEDLKPVA